VFLSLLPALRVLYVEVLLFLDGFETAVPWKLELSFRFLGAPAKLSWTSLGHPEMSQGFLRRQSFFSGLEKPNAHVLHEEVELIPYG
jgi:hypothetical protein